MRCIDLNVDTLKILGTHFSYNEKLKEEKNFYKIVTDMQRVLKIWKMRRLTLEGKIVIFKTIAISKIVFQAFITTVPKHIINELKKIQKVFFWNNSSSKIKHETLCNDNKARGLVVFHALQLPLITFHLDFNCFYLFFKSFSERKISKLSLFYYSTLIRRKYFFTCKIFIFINFA